MDPTPAIPIIEKVVGLDAERMSWLFALLIASIALLWVIYMILRDRRQGQTGLVEEHENGRSQASKDARELRRAVNAVTKEVSALAADLASARHRLEEIGKHVHKIAQIVHADHALVDEHAHRLERQGEHIIYNSNRISAIEAKIE